MVTLLYHEKLGYDMEDSKKMKLLKCMVVFSAARDGVITLTLDDKTGAGANIGR
jgi:hypothetical protein